MKRTFQNLQYEKFKVADEMQQFGEAYFSKGPQGILWLLKDLNGLYNAVDKNKFRAKIRLLREEAPYFANIAKRWMTKESIHYLNDLVDCNEKSDDLSEPCKEWKSGGKTPTSYIWLTSLFLEIVARNHEPKPEFPAHNGLVNIIDKRQTRFPEQLEPVKIYNTAPATALAYARTLLDKIVEFYIQNVSIAKNQLEYTASASLFFSILEMVSNVVVYADIKNREKVPTESITIFYDADSREIARNLKMSQEQTLLAGLLSASNEAAFLRDLYRTYTHFSHMRKEKYTQSDVDNLSLLYINKMKNFDADYVDEAILALLRASESNVLLKTSSVFEKLQQFEDALVLRN